MESHAEALESPVSVHKCLVFRVKGSGGKIRPRQNQRAPHLVFKNSWVWGEGSDEKLGDRQVKVVFWETPRGLGKRKDFDSTSSGSPTSLRTSLANLSPFPALCSPGLMTVRGAQRWALVEAGKKLTGGWVQSMGSKELQGLALPTSVILDCESQELEFNF